MERISFKGESNAFYSNFLFFKFYKIGVNKLSKGLLITKDSNDLTYVD